MLKNPHHQLLVGLQRYNLQMWCKGSDIYSRSFEAAEPN